MARPVYVKKEDENQFKEINKADENAQVYRF